MINRAEISIINENYSEACYYYKKSFKINGGSSNDNYNALLCALELKDVSFVDYNAKRLVEKGICTNFFDQFSDIKNDKIYLNKIKNMKESNQNINWNYRNELEKMLSDDQNVRPINKSNSAIAKIVDSVNFVKFKILVEKYGYPSESMIGIKCSENLKGIAPQPQNILLRHFFQRHYFELDTLLFKALKTLQITPEEYATYTYFKNAPNTRCDISPISKIDDKYYVYKTSDSLSLALEKNRKSICLYSRKDHIEKMKFNQTKNSKEFRISPFTAINSFSGFPSEIKDSLIKNDFQVINF